MTTLTESLQRADYPTPSVANCPTSSPTTCRPAARRLDPARLEPSHPLPTRRPNPAHCVTSRLHPGPAHADVSSLPAASRHPSSPPDPFDNSAHAGPTAARLVSSRSLPTSQGLPQPPDPSRTDHPAHLTVSQPAPFHPPPTTQLPSLMPSRRLPTTQPTEAHVTPLRLPKLARRRPARTNPTGRQLHIPHHVTNRKALT